LEKVKNRFVEDGQTLDPAKRQFIQTVLSDIMDGQMHDPKLRNKATELLLKATPASSPVGQTAQVAKSEKDFGESIQALTQTQASKRRASLPHLQDPKQVRRSLRRSTPLVPAGTGLWDTMLSGILNTAPPERELLDSQKSYLVSDVQRYGIPERVVRLAHKFLTENFYWIRFLFMGVGVIIALLFIAPIIAL
jgi:hypothetical protein